MAEPPITLRAVHDSGAGNLTPTRVVIHATCPDVGYPAASAAGTAHGTALYFQNPASGGSAHYVCDGGREEHCVPDGVIAWHAPPNEHSIGIEICAEGGNYARSYTREQWLSAQVWPGVVRAAARTRELCARFGIPVTKLSVADLLAGRRGICGHVDVSQAWHQSDHSDPGPGFPWSEFLAAVSTGASPQTTHPEDAMTAMEIFFFDDRWLPDPAGLNFRGALPAEARATSQLIDRAWARWAWKFGDVTGFKVTAWDATKAIGSSGSGDYWELPAGVRSITAEGRRSDAGTVVAVTLLTSPK